MYGPKGVGALYVKDGIRIEPLVHGGGQEKGLRSGTENIPAIVAFGKAAEIAKKEMQTNIEHLTKLRDRLIEGLLKPLPYTFLNGHPINRLPDNVSVRYSFIEGESMLLSLELNGVSVSSGSACASKTLEPSHVLLATGLKHEEAHGSIMFSLGRENTLEDVEYVIGLMPGIINRLRAMSPLTPKELKRIMYSDKVMEHFKNPKNTGEIPDADGIGTVGNPVCGDLMTMYIKVKENGLRISSSKLLAAELQ